MLLGLISDTHGLLRPQTLTALHGVDQISTPATSEARKSWPLWLKSPQ